MKICKVCTQEKRLEEFSFKDKTSGRRSNQCKDCDKVYQASRKLANPEKVLEQNRKAQKKYYTSERRRLKTLKLYGLTLKEYESMSKRQNHQCKICEDTKSLVIDHCHTTLAIRGLLCQRCNIGLGWIEDVEWVEKALKYIKM